MNVMTELREENAKLRETVRQLKELKLPNQALYLGLGLSKSERMMISALMASDGICTRDYFLDCLAFRNTAPSSSWPEPKTVDVVICRLRKKLTGLGFPEVIKTEWGEGWRIESTNKSRLKEFFASRTKGA